MPDLLAPAPTREAVIQAPGALMTPPWSRWLDAVWRQLGGLGTASVQSYVTGTCTVTASGFTTTVTGTATYVAMGAVRVLVLPRFQGTSNAPTFSLTGFPTMLDLALPFAAVALARNNGVEEYATIQVTVPATWIITRLASAAWTASGLKMLEQVALTYLAR